MNKFHGSNIVDKLNTWRINPRVQNAGFIGLCVLGPVLLFLTTLTFRAGPDTAISDWTRVLILLDILFTLLIVALISYSILRAISARRAKSAGSRLHQRLSAAFAMVALIPTVLVAIFATLTINIGLEGWFSDRVRDVVGSSLSAAQAYKNETRSDLEEDTRFMAYSIEQIKRTQQDLPDAELRVILTQLQSAVQRGLKEAYLIDGSPQIRSRGEQSYLFGFEAPAPTDLERAEEGEVVVIEDWDNNEFRALKRLDGFVDRYLYVSRIVDGEILKLLDETQETVKVYQQMESQRDRRLLDFGILYLGFAAMVILSAIWMGLLFAERLASPVGRLAGAAARVGAGDFDVRVAEEKGDDEIAMLGRMFNRMTSQVKKQRDDLIEVNLKTEQRRRLFDSILTGVTAGVVGVTPNGNISVMNTAAQRMLNLKPSRDQDRPIEKAVPEFADLFHEVEDNAANARQKEISLTRAGNAEVLMVRIAARKSDEGELEGYVITFDDVTDLVSAQRMAAWGDVARRIAHEIKNPLTPIQLSAERIRRKFGPLLGDKAEELQQYSDVIVRQTGDLRRIVDEFSKFARMPEPQKRPTEISQIIRDAVVLQQTAHEDITISLTASKQELWAEVDETMLSQALINLIKNAAEAIGTHIKNGAEESFEPQIKVAMRPHDGGAEITISDNGTGLPKEQRSRLFEPYVTNRDEGTGLGLSIVKKIIEEHGGVMELMDAPKFRGTKHAGAKARIFLPNVETVETNKKARKVA